MNAHTIGPLEGTLSVDPTGARRRSYISVFNTICPVCNRLCAGVGHYYAIGAPNHVLLHVDCAPMYRYPDGWVHSAPAVGYSTSP